MDLEKILIGAGAGLIFGFKAGTSRTVSTSFDKFQEFDNLIREDIKENPKYKTMKDEVIACVYTNILTRSFCCALAYSGVMSTTADYPYSESFPVFFFSAIVGAIAGEAKRKLSRRGKPSGKEISEKISENPEDIFEYLPTEDRQVLENTLHKLNQARGESPETMISAISGKDINKIIIEKEYGAQISDYVGTQLSDCILREKTRSTAKDTIEKFLESEEIALGITLIPGKNSNLPLRIYELHNSLKFDVFRAKSGYLLTAGAMTFVKTQCNSSCLDIPKEIAREYTGEDTLILFSPEGAGLEEADSIRMKKELIEKIYTPRVSSIIRKSEQLN